MSNVLSESESFYDVDYFKVFLLIVARTNALCKRSLIHRVCYLFRRQHTAVSPVWL